MESFWHYIVIDNYRLSILYLVFVQKDIVDGES